MFFGTIETAGILVGGLVNLLLLTFHLKQKSKSTMTLLFSMMNGTDFLICVLMIPVVISVWSGSKPLFFETRIAREIWLFIWEVCGRTSVFLIGLQSVLRTRALLFPFARRFKKSELFIITMVYITILCALQSVRFFYHVYSIFSPRTNRATMILFWVWKAMGMTAARTIIFFILISLFGYVIPFLPITISCCISVYCIR